MAFTVPEVPGGPDLDEVRKALKVLASPGLTFEIRALPSGRSWVGRDPAEAADAVAGLADGWGVFYTLNPVRPDLASAATNRDVSARRRLLVDVDSVRPQADLPATDIEKCEAAELAEQVLEHLRGLGFPEPAVIDSGNGYHLIYGLDLPNNDLAHQLIAASLRNLAVRFDRPGARVDASVHNAARIARLPGTWNRKGHATDDRPHRKSTVWSAPDALEPVPLDALTALAALGIGADAKAAPPPRPAASGWRVPLVVDGEASAWFRKGLENEAGRAAVAPPGERHNTLRAAARTLGGQLHHGLFTEDEVVAALDRAGERAGLGEKERRDVIAWGVADGKANPLPWPERLPRPGAPSGPAPLPLPHLGGLAAAGEDGASAVAYPFPLVVNGAEVVPKAIDWLWPNRVPYGFLTLLAGRTGVGKSFVTLDLAARLSAGDEIPDGDGECFPVTSSLIIGEDSHEYVLAPRLIEAGADMSKINFMSWEAMAQFNLTDIPMLDAAYRAAGSPGLVVIDPPTNFLGVRDEHRNSEIRSVLMRCAIWAMRQEVACLMITHCNKTQKDIAAVDRIIGSVAWASTSRIAHLLAPDPEDRTRSVFVPMKSNVGLMAPGLAYSIEETDALARVRWLGPIDMNADDALAGEKDPDKERDKRDRGERAAEWLTDQFRVRREWPSKDLRKAARAAGHSYSALYADKAKALPIEKVRVYVDATKYHWVWRAAEGWPEAAPELASP